jgi:nicotinamidase-related amidase
VTDRQVLVVADVQAGLVDGVGAGTVVPTIASAVAGARAAGVPVVFVVTAFRASGGDVGPGNVALAAAAASGAFTEGAASAALHPALAVQADEPVVVKRRVSAFVGTDLEQLLRARGAGTVVVAGLTTAGVVLSTARHAADLDFRTVVLRDACFDPDAAVHHVLLDDVLPTQAAVLDVAGWLDALVTS